ncbi:MAG: flagellar filament capping protein FliD, partial [Candidatus Sericytochromatia bacterium]
GESITDSNGANVLLNTSRDGLAKRLDGFVDSLIKSNSKYNYTSTSGARYEGGMLARINGGESNVSRYDDRIEAYERRLELRERTIRNQFLAMEKVVASLRNQGNYLSGQFAQMAGG